MSEMNEKTQEGSELVEIKTNEEKEVLNMEVKETKLENKNQTLVANLLLLPASFIIILYVWFASNQIIPMFLFIIAFLASTLGTIFLILIFIVRINYNDKYKQKYFDLTRE